MEIPDHLTYLLRNLYVGQEATVRTGHETMDWFKIRKGVRQGCILSPCLFNLHAQYIMQNVRLDVSQAGIKTAGKNTNNLRYADYTTLMAEFEEELKSLLMRVKEETEKLAWNSTWRKLRSSASGLIATAKSLQSCPTLCDPIDGSPPGSPVPAILQARVLEWVAISFSKAWKWKLKVKLLSRVRLLATPWTAAYQAPPPMGFSRQEYWSRVPLPSPLVSLLHGK